MAKKISRQEIAENDLFGDIRSSAEETISVIDKLSEALNETAAAVKKSVGGAKFDSTKAIDNFVKSTEKANKLQKQAIELDKARANAVKARKQAMSANQKQLQEQERTVQQRIKTEEQLARQTERKNKQAERAARIAKDESNAYKKLVKETRDLKNRSKELGAEMMKLEKEGKKNTTQWRALAREYRTTTKAAQQGDAQLKKLDSTVGDNFRNVGNYKSALAGLGKSLLMLGGGLSAISAVRGSFGIIMDFDQAVGDLAAISGKSVDELKPLTDQAKELGATTQFSATQITEMQIELAKLGFTANQISASTEAVANFSAATGADIPAAAALAGSSLRAFGYDASEMERVVSTLGVATTKSALDFSKLETGMSTVAPVAKAFGFEIEDTTALLGVLANSGFDASSAATATRNILLNLADAGGDLAQKLGGPVKNADDLAAALVELRDSGIDLAEALELTDKRSVAAFQTFMDNAETLPELKEGITGVNDELEDMAEKKLDTISGQFTLLQSAWEGWVLSVNEGSGVGSILKDTLGFLAKNLGAVMNALGRLVIAFVSYKAILMASKAANWAFTGGLKDMMGNVKNMITGLMGLGNTAKTAATGVSTMGSALKAVPFLAIASTILQVAAAFWDVKTQAEAAAEATAKIEQAAQKFDEGVSAGQGRVNQKMQEFADERERARLEMEADNLSEAEMAQVRLDLIEQQKEQLEDMEAAEKLLFKKRLVAFTEYNTSLSKAEHERIKNAKTLTEAFDVIVSYQEEQVRLFEAGESASGIDPSEFLRKWQKWKGELSGLGTSFEAAFKELDNTLLEADTNLKKTFKPTKAKGFKKEIKEINTEFSKTIDLAKELADVLDDLLGAEEDVRKALAEREIKDMDKFIKEQFSLQQTLAQNTGELEVDVLDDLLQTKGDMRREFAEESAEFEIMMLNRKFAEEKTARQKALDDEKASVLKKAEETYQENQKNFKGNKNKLKQIEQNYQDALKKIDDNYNEEQKKIDKIELENEEVLATEILAIREDLKNELMDIENETNDEINSMNDALINEQISYYQQQRELAKKNSQEMKDIESQMWQDRMDIANVATDVLIRLTDRRIEKLQEEIDAAQKQSDYLRELAANGNIDAQDSLAEQQRIIDEANRKKIQAEKQKQKIEFANTVFQTYGSKVQSGSETPLSDTIRDVSLLQQFIATFTPFLEGTEDTGTHGQGVDGKGGFHAILHPNERVMTKEQNKMVGDLTNEQLARVAQDYNNGTLMSGSGAMQIGNGWDSHLVLKELQSLKQVIKDKPEHNLEVENVVLGAMEIVHTKKAGRNTYHNRYRVKK